MMTVFPRIRGFIHLCTLSVYQMPYFDTRAINLVDHEINLDDLTPLSYEYESYEARDRGDFDELLDLLGY
jgi:hypothetical protein